MHSLERGRELCNPHENDEMGTANGSIIKLVLTFHSNSQQQSDRNKERDKEYMGKNFDQNRVYLGQLTPLW